VRIALHGDPCHVIQRMPQAWITPAPHHDLTAFATLSRHWCDPAMRAPHVRVPLGYGLGGFGKQPSRDLATDPGEGLHHRDIRGPCPLARLLRQGVQQRADLLATGLQLLGQNAQTGQQEPTMGLRGFGGPRGNGQRRCL
jgi:hypothetical protein